MAATSGGYGIISGLPLRPGLIVLTTEYATDETWSQNCSVGVTGNGKFITDGVTASTAVGRCLSEGSTVGVGSDGETGVNAAYLTNRSLVKIQFTKGYFGKV
jgi:hypothetical protein